MGLRVSRTPSRPGWLQVGSLRWMSSTSNLPCTVSDGVPRSLLWQLVGQLLFLGPSGLSAQSSNRKQHEQVRVAPLHYTSPCVLWSHLAHTVLHPATQSAPRQPNPWMPGILFPTTSTTRAPACDSTNAMEWPWMGSVCAGRGPGHSSAFRGLSKASATLHLTNGCCTPPPLGKRDLSGCF